jgi:prepilin-type N-terminal cleavage/methylation domain-containing protein
MLQLTKTKNNTMKTKPWTRKGFTLVELLVVIAIIVALAALATPAILKQRKKMDMTQAISNSKQVYLVMMDFESDMGNFPDANTAANSDELNSFGGTAANKLLGQLIAGGYTKSEEIFYAKGGNPSGNKRPDDVITPVAKILEAGECGFAYVNVTGTSGLRGLSTSDNGGIPIIMAPVAAGGADPTFKPDPYDNRGVYLRVDGSARQERLNTTDFKMKTGGGKTLFQTGTGTVWGEGDNALTPTIYLPE